MVPFGPLEFFHQHQRHGSHKHIYRMWIRSFGWAADFGNVGVAAEHGSACNVGRNGAVPANSSL
jgi:hypothetical protein